MQSAPDRIRTYDLLLRRQTLYPLSYGRVTSTRRTGSPAASIGTRNDNTSLATHVDHERSAVPAETRDYPGAMTPPTSPPPVAPGGSVPLRPWRGRFVILTGIVLAALNMRIAVAVVSPILEQVREDFVLSDLAAGMLGTIPVAAFAIFGSLTPILARRFGLETTMVGALIVSFSGEVLRSTSTTAPAFLAWTGMALAGMGMGNVLLPPLVKRYFPDRIGPVTAVYTVMLALSTALPPLFVVSLASAYGWRSALGSWAIVGVLATVPWVVVIARSVFARTELAGVLEHAPPSTDTLENRHRHGGRVWRSPTAWGLAVMFGANSLNTYVMFAWLPQILADAGLAGGAPSTGLALYAAIGMPMSVVTPLLAARMRNPVPLLVVFLGSLAAGYTGLALAPSSAPWVWCILAGIGASTFPLGLAMINLRSRTSAGAVSLSGFVQGVGYVIAGAGPVLAGVLYGASGTWTSTFVFLAVMALAVLIGGIIGCRPVMLEDTWGEKAPVPESSAPAPAGEKPA